MGPRRLLSSSTQTVAVLDRDPLRVSVGPRELPVADPTGPDSGQGIGFGAGRGQAHLADLLQAPHGSEKRMRRLSDSGRAIVITRRSPLRTLAQL